MSKSTTAAGHNSIPAGADRLRSIVDRIERLESDRASLAADIKDIYAEAKSDGFDVKVLRALIRDRKRDAAEVEEQETLLDVYKRALGMLAGTPLGDAALRGAGG